jgi:hypothetical protein
MTTHGAATTRPPRRIFLGLVVPLLYILALAAAVSLASGGTKARSPQMTLATDHVRAKAMHRTHHAKRATRPHRHVAKPTVRRSHAPRVVSTPPPVIDVPVSRSDDRVAVAEVAPALVIHIAAVTGPLGMQSAINSCQGPVEIVWGVYPTEIAQHDYCGGSAFSALTAGQQVQVIGGGLTGTYVVNGDFRYASVGSSASQLDGIGDIALQTCVTDGVILVGLDRVP